MNSESETIRQLLSFNRIAIVGLSDDPMRPSYGIATYLLSHGKQIVPVNPALTQILGLPCFPSLKDVPGQIELVNVFRRSEFCADVVREAIAAGAKGVWLQSGIRSEEGRKLAKETGVLFVQDRCIMVEHSRQQQV